MRVNRMLLTAGAAAWMSMALPAPANASFWCWLGKCGGSSGSSGGGSSGGAPTPEPGQMALFAMGAAVLVGRAAVSRRRKK